MFLLCVYKPNSVSVCQSVSAKATNDGYLSRSAITRGLKRFSPPSGSTNLYFTVSFSSLIQRAGHDLARA